MIRRFGLFLIIAAIFLTSVSVARAEDQRNILKNIGINQKVNQKIPLDLTFKNERGETVPLSTYFGKKPVLLAPVYYKCPMLCGLVLNGIVRMSRGMNFTAGNEYNIVAFSFNPEEGPDLAAAKKENIIKEYGRRNSEGGWNFLTGDPTNIKALTDAIGFKYEYDAESKEFAHPGMIVVLSPEGKIFRYFTGIDFAPREVKSALIEAAEGKIGSIIDQAILFCYHYNPSTGKYGWAIINMIRIFGTLTFLILAGYVISSILNERKKKSGETGVLK